MGCEITLKVLAEGLLFTPKALVKDISGVLDIFIFGVSLIWLCWMPTQVEPNSLAQLLMLLRYLNIYFIDDGHNLWLYYFVWYEISNTSGNDKFWKHIDRCCRPLRILILVPHMRRVVVELCRGFKEVLLVFVLLLVLIFVFATWGLHLFGMKFAACNDPTITKREDCVGTYRYIYIVIN